MREYLPWQPALERHAFLIVMALLFLMLSGCSMPGRTTTPAKQTYELQAQEVSSVSKAGASGQCFSLRVAIPAAAPGFSTARMAYTTEPPRLDYFAYHEWVAPPARMIAPVIETWLHDSKIFEAVVFGSDDIRTDLRLDSELVRLSQDFKGSVSTLTLVIKVKLVGVSTRALLDAKTFSYTEQTAGANPEAGAVAANRAVTQFLADLAVFLAGSISQRDCPDVEVGSAMGSDPVKP